jgi:hypothetical protein
MRLSPGAAAKPGRKHAINPTEFPLVTMPVSHFTWQVLRAVLRSKKPPTGRELRLVPNRATRDGTFLDKLVKDGLLQVVSVDPLPKGSTRQKGQKPIQFRTRYKLTEKGKYAAEYGEYEREVQPNKP